MKLQGTFPFFRKNSAAPIRIARNARKHPRREHHFMLTALVTWIWALRRYASGSPGLLALLGYIGGEGLTNFYLACVGTVIAMVVSFAATFVLYGVYEKRGKLDPVKTGKSPESVSAEAKKPVAARADNEIVAIINGKLIPASKIQDEAFAQEVLEQTVAIEPADGVIASPANGMIERATRFPCAWSTEAGFWRISALTNSNEAKRIPDAEKGRNWAFHDGRILCPL